MEKEKTTGKREIVFLAVLIITVLALRLPHMYDPLDSEEGLFAYGAAIISNGGLPYRDVYSSSPPFMFYLYKAAFDMNGKSAEAVRNFTTAYVIMSMLLIYMMARSLSGSTAAMLASFFYVMFLNSRFTGGLGSGAALFTHFTVIFALFFMLDRDRTYEKANFFLTGFLMSTAVFTSTDMLPVLAIPLIYAFLYIGERKRAASGMLWYIAGMSTLAALAVLWSVKNSMSGVFFDAVVKSNMYGIAAAMKAKSLQSAFLPLLAFMGKNLVFAAALIYSIAGLFLKKDSQLNSALVLTVIALAAGIMAVKNAQPADYSVLIPYLSILAALMIKDGFLAAKDAKAFGPVLASVIIVLSAVELAHDIHAAGVLKNIFKPGGKAPVFSEARVVAGEIRAVKGGGTSLFAWPDGSGIYFYSGIKAGQRVVRARDYGMYGNEFRETMASLEASPPDYIVLEKGPDEKLFDNILKKYYSKSLEGERLVLYKKGGAR